MDGGMRFVTYWDFDRRWPCYKASHWIPKILWDRSGFMFTVGVICGPFCISRRSWSGDITLHARDTEMRSLQR